MRRPPDDIDRRHMAFEAANSRNTLPITSEGNDGLHLSHLRSTIRSDWIPPTEKSGAKQRGLLGEACVSLTSTLARRRPGGMLRYKGVAHLQFSEKFLRLPTRVALLHLSPEKPYRRKRYA